MSEYTDTLAAMDILATRDSEFRQRLEKFFRRRLEAIWKANKGRRKFQMEKATGLELPQATPMTDHLRSWARRWEKRVRDCRSALTDKLKSLAEAEDIPVDDTGVIYFRVGGLNHHTQGYGCNKYAHGDAMMELLKLQSLGVRAYILTQDDKRPDHPGPYYVSTKTYCVLAYTNELGADICRRRRAKLPDKEMMRALLKMSINPRVYFPFMDYDWESKMGLDAFGDDV